jgi:Na+/H+ antiporter NhaD/arsenite permease-like protein
MSPRLVLAAAVGPALDLPVWSVLPFVLLLLAIAVLPLAAEHWWHQNRNKALVAAVLAIPTAGYLFLVGLISGQATMPALGHEMANYVSFIVLLGSLYIVSGGIVVAGDLDGKPLTNTTLLGIGCVLANLIGTTGASALLIRPYLRINKKRRYTLHVPIFFIFTVSNLGGLLTPLGDPPLFLGYLHQVPFFWTFDLWREWLLVNAVVLGIFFIWDTLAWRREPKSGVPGEPGAAARSPLRLQGLVNVPLLAGIMAGVLLQGVLPDLWSDLVGGGVMAAMALVSLTVTPKPLREANGFTWEPILEVAILFAGIFVTMVPALALLERHRDAFGITQPWQFFWLTGSLSAFLDNAPTYLTFATMAAGSSDFSVLVNDQVPGINGPLVLQAISCGAVFMGALTYIGNGPNFMVKAIAEQSGYKMPAFFGFLAYACVILLPVFVLVTLIFFRP